MEIMPLLRRLTTRMRADRTREHRDLLRYGNACTAEQQLLESHAEIVLLGRGCDCVRLWQCDGVVRQVV